MPQNPTPEQLEIERLQREIATEKEESADLEAVIDELDAIIDSPKSASSKYAVVVQGAKDMKAKLAAAEADLDNMWHYYKCADDDCNRCREIWLTLGKRLSEKAAIDAAKTDVKGE